MGHSYGGYVTILLAALDERVAFACASGCVCSYKRRMLARTGIELSQAIPPPRRALTRTAPDLLLV